MLTVILTCYCEPDDDNLDYLRARVWFHPRFVLATMAKTQASQYSIKMTAADDTYCHRYAAAVVAPIRLSLNAIPLILYMILVPTSIDDGD